MPERGQLAVATLACATFAAWVAGSAVPAQDFRPLVVLHAAAAPIDLAYVNTVIGKMNTVIQAAGPCSNIRFYRGAAPAVSAEVPATTAPRS